jgi:uncharacterized protein YjiS (DUF1127 family)
MGLLIMRREEGGMRTQACLRKGRDERGLRLATLLRAARQWARRFVHVLAGADSATRLSDRLLRDIGLWRDRDGRLRSLDGSDGV